MDISMDTKVHVRIDPALSLPHSFLGETGGPRDLFYSYFQFPFDVFHGE